MKRIGTGSSSGWKDDPTVPTGWKTKKGYKTTHLLDPYGNSFASRRKALQNLIKSGANSELVESIRSSLLHDGWTPGGDELPPNWYSRVSSLHAYHFISSDGELLPSKELAIKYLMSSSDNSSYYKSLIGKFSRSDIASMRLAVGLSNMKSGKSAAGWREDDPTVPAGWKSKKFAGKATLLLDPYGTRFSSRRKALQHLIKSGADSEFKKFLGA